MNDLDLENLEIFSNGISNGALCASSENSNFSNCYSIKENIKGSAHVSGGLIAGTSASSCKITQFAVICDIEGASDASGFIGDRHSGVIKITDSYSKCKIETNNTIDPSTGLAHTAQLRDCYAVSQIETR